MRKLLRIALIAAASLVALIAIALGTSAAVNAIASHSEAASLAPYGERIPVDGRQMNVVIHGGGDETVVLLPGLGTAAPALDFEPLIAQLEDTYRVIAVEPFGTGLSDQTDSPRTSANIASEVHSALRSLGVDRFILMGHSIAGIYALEYANTYPEDLTAFVGIDSSVPGQPGSLEATPVDGVQTLKSLGLLRVLDSIGPDPLDGLPYSAEATEQMRILSLRNAFTDTAIDELTRTPENFTAAEALSFPKDLPLLLLVANEDPELDGWLALHEEQAATVDNGSVLTLPGGHYLHHTASPEIAAELARFTAQLP